MKIKSFSMAALSAAVEGRASCGGGSDPVAETPAPQVPTPTLLGVLTDSAVGGVAYHTSAGYTGVTNREGQFRYNSGEKVTFSVGDLTLGEVDAAATITPIQLA